MWHLLIGMVFDAENEAERDRLTQEAEERTE